MNQEIEIKHLEDEGQRPTLYQGLYRCWYVKPINPEKTNRNNNGGSVGKSYSHVHEGFGRVTPGQRS